MKAQDQKVNNQTNDTQPATDHQPTINLIHKDMTIGELVQKYPSCIEVLMNKGVHCIGCGAAFFETIEEGLKGHGMSDEQVEEVVKQLNEAIPEEVGGSDESVKITEKAVKKLKEILKEQKKEDYGLRIAVIPGGCSGFQYAFDFEKEEKENDTVVEVDAVKFFVDNESMKKLKGAIIDYVETLQGAGFKISNPNATGTCGCGQSFS